jgi:hypothetical protein
LVRIFAIEHFYHFAYMSVGVAMLGFGVAGTGLAVWSRFNPTSTQRLFVWSSGLTAVALILTPAFAHQISVDPTQLLWDPGQWPALGLMYLLLALPFCLGALTVLSALTMAERPGYTYGAAFLGSGLGATVCIASLWLITPESALALPAVLAALGFMMAVMAGTTTRSAMAPPGITIAVSVLILLTAPWQLTVSPYKALPQVEAYPAAQRMMERSSPLGWTVAVETPAFRFAPGLSLAFGGTVPSQTAVFVDGALAGAVPSSPHNPAESEFLNWLPTSLPYAMGLPQHVLVVGSAAGTETRNALAHAVPRITAIELNPDLVALSRTDALVRAEREGRLDWVIGDARSYLSRTRRTFDLIVLPPAGSFGTSAAGVHGLAEDFLHTSDAYSQYLRRLSSTGTLAITRWTSLPLRQTIRVILTAVEALRRVEPQAVENGLVVARSWGTATVLVKPAGFTVGEIERLRDWAGERLFDLDWHPGLNDPATKYNYLEEPTPYLAAAAAVRGKATSELFAASYSFDVAPVGDAQPYPHHFLRLGSLASLLGSDRGSWLPFAEWGQIALVATLAQSVLLAALLMLLPAAFTFRSGHGGGWIRLSLYFGAIGLAYLSAEIAAIQQLSLLLGHPVYAVSLVLTAVLVCSGFGSIYSDRVAVPNTGKTNLALMVLLAALGLGLLNVVHLLQPFPLAVRMVAAGVAIAPAAFLMGLPFPLGLRSLADDGRSGIAWAWAANGFAAAVAAPLAALIALELGSPMLFFIDAAGYRTAALSTLGNPATREA